MGRQAEHANKAYALRAKINNANAAALEIISHIVIDLQLSHFTFADFLVLLG